MAFDTLNLKNSAAQLAAKTAAQPPLNTNTKPKIFTAAQATTAVQNYAKSIDAQSLDSIIANYQYIFDTISLAAGNGDTAIEITTTNFDYTYIQPLLTSYGYIVSDLPSASANPSDTTLKYNITISWPSVVPKPITGISPTSFIAIQNSQYSVTFVPQGGQGPYTFALAGQLPAGWTYSDIRRVSSLTAQGISSELGGGSLVLTVVDSISQTFTATINWTVTQPAQISTDWNATTGLGQILNKPTSFYLGSTSIPFPGTENEVELTGITSIDGNAATVTNGVYTTGEYANPTWITALAGSKITGSVANADKLNTARNINGVSFNGTENISINSLVNGSTGLTLDNQGQLSYSPDGPTIDWAYGTDNNGLQIMANPAHPQGPGDLRLFCTFNGQFNQITVNRGGIGLQSATSDGQGGFTSPATAITMSPTNIVVNGSIQMGGLVTFTGGTNGLTKANVGLSNVDNVSNATLLNNTTFTGTTNIPLANITNTTGTITSATITTATVTQGTLTTVNNTNDSLVNKQYVDSKIWLALAVGY